MADAIGATRLTAGQSLTLAPDGRKRWQGAARGLLVLSFLLLGAGLTAPIGLHLGATRLERSVGEARGPGWGRVIDLRRRLDASRFRLASVDGLTRAVQVTPLLHDLAGALPPGSAITELDFANDGTVRLEVIGSNVADIVLSLEETDGIDGVRFSGAIERAELDGSAYERATVVLGLARLASGTSE